ncbi:hypothetical protein WJX82_008474 [Trebouxia sp. C0006]
MANASSAPAPTSGAQLQADSPQADSTQADSTQADSTQADSSQANNPHQLKDVATSDAALQNNTETASLKEELGAVKVSVSDSEARNAELQTKLESALAKVAAVKANSKPLKVPGFQQEREAVAVAKETHDAQLEKKNAEIQLLKKRFAIPTYVKRQGWIWGNSIGQGRNGSLCPVGNPDVPNTVFKQGSPSELEHEAAIMHELRHPNVVQSFGLISAKGPDGVGTHRLVPEHMKCSLEDIMKTRRLTVKEMVIGFYQLTSGLDHMHLRLIVDQDVHRGNVLISQGDGSWKKGDLGSAARCQRNDGEWNRILPKDCRIAFGSESPDLAAMLIDRKYYVPLPAFDMWPVGLLILDVVGGQRPDDHCAVLRDPVYVSEAQRGVRDPVGLPGQRRHMEYLAQHVQDKASYVKKIKLPTPGVDSPALQEDEKAPYQVLLKFIKACLSTIRENRPEAFEVAYALFKAAADAKWL